MDIYGDLVELEVDAINSQLFCMDIEEIGKKFRGEITFWGEISRQQALNNPDPEISRQAVRRVKASLYDEKGGVIAQCSYEGEGRPENINAVYDEWGR